MNPAQKPGYLAYKLCFNHVSPEARIMVFCAGMGGEIIGAMAAGHDVIAFESDDFQFKELTARLNSASLVVEGQAWTMLEPDIFSCQQGSWVPPGEKLLEPPPAPKVSPTKKVSKPSKQPSQLSCVSCGEENDNAMVYCGLCNEAVHEACAEESAFSSSVKYCSQDCKKKGEKPPSPSPSPSASD